MKKLIVIIIFCTFGSTLMHAQTGPPVCNDFVTLNGRYFECGGELFYPLAVNYSFQAVYTGSTPESDYSDVFLSRNNSYGQCGNCYDPCGYEATTENSARAEIKDDLSVIHDKGFNAIRTTFGFDKSYLNSADTFVLNLYRCDGWAAPGPQMYITTANHDKGRAKMFYFFDEILEIAYEDSLKVLLDICYDSLTPGSFETYLVYLKQLAQHVQTLDSTLQQTLLAYVVLEEALLEQGEYEKGEVCTMVAQMYDTLKTYDPYHLVTVGGLNVQDVMRWDPGVMKLDFWCPHMYPYPEEYESDADAAVERLKGILYWLKNNSPMPWMIGETGFGATDDEIGFMDPDQEAAWPYGWDCGYLGYPIVNGELQYPLGSETYTQTVYADSMLKWVRDCGGSGFTIWEFQEAWRANPPKPDVNGNSHGILRHGEAISGTADIGGTIFKPVVDVFSNYLDANGQPPDVDVNGGQMPTNYYNPFNHSVVNNAGCANYKYHRVRGRISDQNNSDVDGAFLWAWVDLGYQIDPDNRVYELIHTFSNSEGDYTLYAYNHHPSYIDGYFITDVMVSSIGSEIDTAGWGDVDSIFNTSLNKTSLLMEATVSDDTVSTGNSENFKGWNTLETTDLIIENGATSDLHARTEVHIDSEFHAEYGSEVHIYCDDVFPDCSDFNGYKMPEQNGDLYAVNGPVEKEIELKFAESEGIGSLIVSPNPGSGTFKVQLTRMENNVEINQLVVLDMTGRQVYNIHSTQKSITIDLSSNQKGIYFLQVIDNYNELYQEKLIIQ